MLGRMEGLGLPGDQSMTITRDGQEVQVAGSGQPATMRAWLIQALTGRRASEILLMDFEPLSPVPGIDPAPLPTRRLAPPPPHHPPHAPPPPLPTPAAPPPR